MAIIFWRRAKMNFQSSLKPSLASPALFSPTISVENVVNQDQLIDICKLLNAQWEASDGWFVDVSPAYIAWRYLMHPADHYKVRRFNIRGRPAGFLVYKKIFCGLNMLIDCFVLEGHFKSSLNALPWLTICLLPKSVTDKFGIQLWPIPVNKEIPFFFTKDQEQQNTFFTRFFGLSASDF
jgi:hypothetical protein